MPARNVSLTAHFSEFLDGCVASGQFSNASEVVREGLRLLEQRQREAALKLDALRAAVELGLEDVLRMSARAGSSAWRQARSGPISPATGDPPEASLSQGFSRRSGGSSCETIREHAEFGGGARRPYSAGLNLRAWACRLWSFSSPDRPARRSASFLRNGGGATATGPILAGVRPRLQAGSPPLSAHAPPTPTPTQKSARAGCPGRSSAAVSSIGGRD